MKQVNLFFCFHVAVSMHTTFFKLHIGIVKLRVHASFWGGGGGHFEKKSLAVQESNEMKTSMEVATFLFRKELEVCVCGGGGGGWSTEQGREQF